MIRAALKSLLGRKVRLVMSTFAVVLGVAFVAGTLVFTDTLNRSFTALFASTVGDVVVEAVPDAERVAEGPGDGGGQPEGEVLPMSVTGIRTLPAALVDRLSTVKGATRADGNVLAPSVFVIDSRGKVMGGLGAALATNWTGAPAGHGLTGLQVVAGRAPKASDEILLDAATADRAGHWVGSDVTLATGSSAEAMQAKVVGIADFAEGGSFSGATWVGFDTATAQRLFTDGENRFTSIWVTAAAGTSQEQLRDEVARVLPQGVRARTGDEVADEAASQLLNAISFLTTFLLIFAGISLVVGAFLIVNTFSILVAQRSRELALLRALGASRRQVSASVLFEAFVVGVTGATIGVLLGVAMAEVIRRLFGAVGLDLSGQALVLQPRTFVVSYAVGIVVTMVAAWFPARRSARIAPVQAMRDDVALPESSLRHRFLGGLALIAAGAGVLFLGLGGGEYAGWFVGGGILAVLLGVSAGAPVLCQPFLVLTRAVFGVVFGTVGRLAGQNSLRNPRRTSATASALMIGLALSSTMAIVGDSAKASVDRALEQSFRGDYVVSNAIGRPFSPELAQRIRKVDGVEQVVAQRFGSGVVDGTPQGVVAVRPEDLSGLLDVRALEGDVAALAKGRVLLGESYAAERRLGVGDAYRIRIGKEAVALEVVGVIEDNALLRFPVVTAHETLTGWGLAERDSVLVVDVDEPGAVVEAGIGRVVEKLPTVNVKDQASYAEEQRRPINQMVLMIFALLGLALLIAVLGIVNTLALSVIERTREIGLLRAIGLSRTQTRRMITIESVVIAALGSVLGVVLGVGFGIALMQSLREQGLEVVSVPWDQLAAFVAVALVVGVLAAVLPARRAAQLDVLAAISTE